MKTLCKRISSFSMPGLLLSTLLLFILAPILFSACGTNTPVVTIEWEEDGNGFRQFRTNDSQWDGWTFWYYTGSSNQDPMDTVEAQVKKVSGSTNGGFGMLFCWNDHDNFYVYAINVAGEYSVFKRVAGEWTTIIDWPTSAAVNTGFGTLNTLKVTYESGTDTFTLYANNTIIDTFTDTSFSWGSSGYECYISGDGIFPETPEDYRFYQVLPVTDP